MLVCFGFDGDDWTEAVWNRFEIQIFKAMEARGKERETGDLCPGRGPCQPSAVPG